MNEQQETLNLRGRIDALKYRNACIVTLPGKTYTKRGVFIPIDDNDVYVTKEEGSNKATHAFLGMQILQRQEASQYGKTHYAKPTYSKAFREAHPDWTEEAKKIYLGDFEPFTFEGGNAAERVEAQTVEVAPEEKDDLPF